MKVQLVFVILVIALSSAVAFPASLQPCEDFACIL